MGAMGMNRMPCHAMGTPCLLSLLSCVSHALSSLAACSPLPAPSLFVPGASPAALRASHAAFFAARASTLARAIACASSALTGVFAPDADFVDLEVGVAAPLPLGLRSRESKMTVTGPWESAPYPRLLASSTVEQPADS